MLRRFGLGLTLGGHIYTGIGLVSGINGLVYSGVSLVFIGCAAGIADIVLSTIEKPQPEPQTVTPAHTTSAEFLSWLENPAAFWLQPTSDEIAQMLGLIYEHRPDLRTLIETVSQMDRDSQAFNMVLAGMMRPLVIRDKVT